jgi:hypothetical protein
MARLAMTPLAYHQLIKNSFAAYPFVFKKAWPLFLLAPLPHLILPLLFVYNQTFGWAALFGSILFTWYIFAVILFRVSAGLYGTAVSYTDAFSVAVSRYIKVLGGNVLFFAALLIIGLAEFSIWLTVDVMFSSVALMGAFIIIDAFLFTLIYFAIPIIVLDKLNVLPAFGHSAILVKRSWFRTFMVLLSILMVIMGLGMFGILLTSTNRMLLLTLFDYVYQLVAYPLIISVTLTLLNDLKLRTPKVNTN